MVLPSMQERETTSRGREMRDTMYLLPAVASTPKRQPLLDVIHNVDALVLLRGLSDGCIDCIVTSPPYDDLRVYSGNWSFPFEAIAREAYRVLKPGGVLVWVVGDMVKYGSETLNSMRQALYFVDTCGFRMHDTMIYQKDGSPFPESTRYWQEWEYMFVLSKGTPKTANLLKIASTHRNKSHVSDTTRKADGSLVEKKYSVGNETRTMANIWYIQNGYMKTTRDVIAYQHPAMFPEELARRHILTWTNPGDTVLDFFAGSGTTLKMARNLNRRYIGCDISSEYVELARKRLRDTDPFQDRQITPELRQRSLFAGVTI
jgi:DNA modification methylase